MRYTVRPLSDRTWLRPASARQASRFDSTWSSTLDLLGREVEHLRGRDLVLEVDVPERGIRNDGQLRADAKATSPAVVVAFESKHGSMQYRFKALGAGTAMPASHMTKDRAIALLTDQSRDDDPVDVTFQRLYRRARAAAHPDRHDGDRTMWNELEQAAIVLGLDR